MAVAKQDDISDIELSKFFLSWDCFAEEHDKLKEVCTGLDDQSIFALARHGLICIEKKVGSNQVCISDEDAAENETILKNENLNIEKLLSACSKVDPSVFVLALQGFCDIVDESDELYHEWFSVPLTYKTAVRQLRKWRCESPFQYQYKKEETFMRERVIRILKSLTIFKTFGVPLFIDNYGNKEVLRNHVTEDIDIDKDTPIYHVTHKAEAEKIFEEKCLKPSDNKNIIAGTWFGIDDGKSIYGSRAFKTTLSKLGVQVLRQGEIVSYKEEVNFILYAGKPDLRQWDDKLKAKGLKKPIASESDYVKISIFVPSEFLPNTDYFSEVFDKPFKVDHSGLCVREKRSFGRVKCTDHVADLFAD